MNDKHTDFMSLDILDELTETFIGEFGQQSLDHDMALTEGDVAAIRNFTRWVKHSVRARINAQQRVGR